MASSFLRWSIKIASKPNLDVMSPCVISQRSPKSPMVTMTMNTMNTDMVTPNGRFFLPLRMVPSMQLLRKEFALV